MASEFMLVHYNCEIQNTQDGVTFCCEHPVCVKVLSSITLSELHRKILQKLHQENGKITKMLYRIPLAITQGAIRYGSVMVDTDDDVRTMFDCHARVSEVHIIEVFVALGDSHLSSEGSAPNSAAVGVSPAEHSPTFAMSSPVQNENVRAENEDDMVGSPSFAHLAKQVTGEFSRDGPIAGKDFIVDNGDCEDEPAEVSCDGGDDEVAPVIQSQPSRSHSQSQSQSQRVGHYSTLNLEAKQVSNFPRFSGIVDDGDTMGLSRESELHKGQLFPNKEAVLLAVKNYSIRRRVQYKVFESDPTKYHGKCKHFGNGCNWSIRVTYRQKKRLWEIRKYNGEHGCLMSTRHSQGLPKLDSEVIVANIYSLVEADPTVPIKVLQGSVHSKYGFKVSYRKVWLAKEKAIARIYGEWEESYNELPKWLQGLQTSMPGTIIELSTRPYYGGNIVDHTCVMFHRLFWTFPPCVEAFKYCKPLISVDGTHLYGKYGGTLLMAIAQDGNSNILPIAFAVVEGETREAWSFFLTNLRRHVTPQEGILIISDAHDAIKAALDAEGSGWHPPHAHHAYCIRHVVSNFAMRFKSKDAMRALTNAAHSMTPREFLNYYGMVKGENPDFAVWVDRIPTEKWTLHQDKGRRFGHMTTNLSECINTVLKGVRNLPITALVKSTYFRLVELFVRNGREVEAQLAANQMYSQGLMQEIEINKQSIGTMTVHEFSRANDSFVVDELAPIGNRSQRSYRVRLADRWCDCGYFQALHYPCRHVFAACTHAQLDWGAYVHDVYRMQTVFNVYKMKFVPIVNEDHWPPYYGPQIRPDPELRRAKDGRPLSGRIRNEMDEVEPGHGKHCGLCGQVGHTRQRCPTILPTS